MAPILGIVFALIAAEGSNRVGSLVAAFGGGDSSFYGLFLLVSIVSAGAFLGILLGKSHKIARYGLIALNVLSCILLLGGPAFSVVQQILLGMVVTSVCLFLSKEKQSVTVE